MEARFQLNALDLSALRKIAALHRDTRLNNAINPLVLLALLVSTAYALFAPIFDPTLRAPATTQWPGVLYFVAPFVVFDAALIYILVVISRARKEQRKFSEPNHVTLDRNGVTRHTENSAHTVQWRGIKRVAATDNHLCLLSGASAGFVVPRRAFESDDEWQRFINFARDHWEQTRPVPAPIAAA